MSVVGGGLEADLRRQAEQRVDARQGFWSHASVFVVVNTGLVVLNLITSPQYLWCLWPVFGWGLGLAAHAWGVFGTFPGDRERAVAAEIERLRARQRPSR
jgi:hypothetical protein